MNSEPYPPVFFIYQSLPLIAAVGGYVFFIVASLSIARSRTGRLAELMELGALGAATGTRIIEQSEKYLLCTQMGRLCSSFGAGFCLAFLTGHIAHLPSEEDVNSVSSYGVLLATASAVCVMLATLVVVQVAKAFTLQFPEKTLCLVALPLRFFYIFVGPVLMFIHNTVTRVLERFEIRLTTERDISLSTDDLSEIVKLSSESGTMEQSDQRLIEGVVDFAERVVREVMTPRKDIVWTKDTLSTEELIALCTREGVSRVLICGTDLDDVKGMILAKDLLKFINKPVTTDAWRALLRPIYKVPNTKPVDDLLYEFRSTGTHLAVVLDEHGGVGGIVTLEDLVEEIVGDIFDETDTAMERELVIREVDGEWLVDGAAGIDQLPEAFGITPSEGRYDTIAGYLLSHVGRLPEQGETFNVEGLEFKVLELHRHRIVRLAVKVLPRQEEALKSDELPIAVNGSSRSQRKTAG
jgi:CBS domain containing-hemolysin-like protein